METNVKELRGQLEERSKRAQEIVKQAKTDDSGVLDLAKAEELKGLADDTARVEAFKALNDEIDDLTKKLEPHDAAIAEATRAEEAAKRFGQPQPHPGHVTPGVGGQPVKAVKTIGEMFAESDVRGVKHTPYELGDDVEVKTLMETSAGWAPETIRTGRLVEDAQRPIQVIDVIPSGSTSQAAVVFMEETTFTNNAAEASEGGTYGEAALALTEQSSTVRKIGVWLPVTDEQLEDVPQITGYINNRLPFMLRQRLDGQVLVGDGNAPNLDGFLNVSGIQTQAKGSDPGPDAIYKAMTKVRVTGRANPGAVIFHPNDWQDFRLLRTADGVYIWGNPSDVAPERIWGLPVVQSDAITEGTALVGDYAAFTELTMRRGIEVQVTNAHSDFFIKGKQAIRADVRCALVVYRPAALCSVTGL